MRRRTIVFIVCSPHARTGVSTTARLLTDFYLARNQPVEGFDTDPHEPTYGPLFGDVVRVIDATDIRGQIALFDRLLVHDEIPKVVDVWHRSYERFFATVKDIGFIEEARRSGVEPVVLFHADATETALAGALALAAAWRDQTMIVVNNEGAAPLGAKAHEILARYPARRKFVIAALNGPIAKALEVPGFSLSRFLLAAPSD
ncbi:MAG: hypothetical protein HYZ60_05960, partial [Methylocystis sp.]|nr:hypothetical protein [Methylocystis sp.]